MATARSLIAGAATAAAGTGAAAGSVLLCRGAVGDLAHGVAAHGWTGLGFETLLGGVAAAVLAIGVAWLGVTGALTALALLTGLGRATAARLTPALVRRAVAICCGATLTGPGAVAAHAADAPGAAPVSWSRGSAAQVLTGLPVPDRPGATGRARSTSGGTAGRYVVRTGDSLWRVTARALGAQAGDAAICAGSDRLYRLNRAEVGPNPDLLLPGTILRLPADWGADPTDRTTPREDPS